MILLRGRALCPFLNPFVWPLHTMLEPKRGAFRAPHRSGRVSSPFARSPTSKQNCNCAWSTRRLGPRCCQRCRRQATRSEEHTSELQSQSNLVCRLLLEKKKKKDINTFYYKKNQTIKY